MKKTFFSIRKFIALFIGLSFTASAFACDNAALILNSYTALPGGQYQINMTFTVGAGRSTTATGADQNTGTFGFFVAGAPLVSYPATLVSPNTNATFTASVALSDTILVYENETQWWACIEGTCGPIQTVTKTISIVTQGLPSSICLKGMEGSSTMFGCDGPEMLINFNCSSLKANAGADKEVFPAWTPSSCASLTGTAAGGSGNYGYKWSTNATTATISACPSATTTYTLTVKDNTSQCTATDQVVVGVTNISCGNNKLTVCQGGVTKCLPKSQVQSTLNAGGKLGACK